MEILTLNFSQLFEYLYFSYSFIDFPRPVYTCLIARARITIGEISCWLF